MHETIPTPLSNSQFQLFREYLIYLAAFFAFFELYIKGCANKQREADKKYAGRRKFLDVDNTADSEQAFDTVGEEDLGEINA